METAYLKKCFGNSLTQALAEVASVQPSDPIEYLAHWLYHYRDVTNAEEKVRLCTGPAWEGGGGLLRTAPHPRQSPELPWRVSWLNHHARIA